MSVLQKVRLPAQKRVVDGKVPEPLKETDLNEDNSEEWVSEEEEEDDLVEVEPILAENEVIESRQVTEVIEKPRKKKKQSRVKVIREVIRVIQKEEPAKPVVEHTKEQTRTEIKPPDIRHLPTRIGEAKTQLKRALAVASEQEANCPVCDVPVLAEENLVRYGSCGHFAHMSCASSAAKDMHTDSCLTCAKDNIEMYGTASSMFDVIEGATRSVTVPDPNSDRWSILAGHSLTPLRAMYSLRIAEAHETEGEEVPIITDETARQVAHAYGAESACPAPATPLEETEFDPKAKGISGIAKNVRRGLQKIIRQDGGAVLYEENMLQSTQLEEMLSSGVDIEDILHYGFRIHDLISKNINIDFLFHRQYTLNDLHRLGATRDQLKRIGFQLKHLNNVNPHDLEALFGIDGEFVFTHMAMNDWRNLARARVSPQILNYYNMQYDWMVQMGVHPYFWDEFSYIKPTEFRDCLGLNGTVFEHRSAIASRIVKALNWDSVVLRDVFSVQVDESTEEDTNETMQSQYQNQSYEPNNPNSQNYASRPYYPPSNPRIQMRSPPISIPSNAQTQPYYPPTNVAPQQTYNSESYQSNREWRPPMSHAARARMNNNELSAQSERYYYPPPQKIYSSAPPETTQTFGKPVMESPFRTSRR